MADGSLQGHYQCACCGDIYSASPFNRSHLIGPARCDKWRCWAKAAIPGGNIGTIVALLFLTALMGAYRRLRSVVRRD